MRGNLSSAKSSILQMQSSAARSSPSKPPSKFGVLRLKLSAERVTKRYSRVLGLEFHLGRLLTFLH